MPKLSEKQINKLQKEILSIIKPNYNDEWFDSSKHFKEATKEIIELIKKLR